MADATALRERLPTTRPEAEAQFDALVRENRFTIAVLFPFVGAVLLLASAGGLLPPWLAFNPLLVLVGVAVMRLPLIAGLTPLLDRRATLGVLLLTAYAYGIEYTGVHTGFPYGTFSYGVSLGPTVAGVPIGLPVFFLPLVVNAYLLCLLLLRDRADSTPLRLAVVVAAVLLMDVVLDPGAVALGFWHYPSGGIFYGVPLSNYRGWILSSVVSVVALDLALDRTALHTRLRSCEFMLDDLVSFVILWGGINVWFGHLLPAAVAVAFGVGLLTTDRFDASLFGPSVVRR